MSGWMQSLRALARLKPTQKLTRDYLISLLTAVLLALAVGAAIMLVCGHNPIEGYGALIEGALGKPRAIGNTLAKTVTLCLTGLAMSLAAKAGVFNVGGEGQLYLGAMAAAVVGAQLDAPAWLVTLLALLAAMAAGGLYALLPGALKVKWMWTRSSPPSCSIPWPSTFAATWPTVRSRPPSAASPPVRTASWRRRPSRRSSS